MFLLPVKYGVYMVLYCFPEGIRNWHKCPIAFVTNDGFSFHFGFAHHDIIVLQQGYQLQGNFSAFGVFL
jgi:hypothetical protein